MKIIGCAGSDSPTSINQKLVEYSLSLLPSSCDTELFSLVDIDLPLYSPPVEERMDSLPDAAVQFAQMIDSADAIVLSVAEYNGSFTTAFKNLYDWMSRVPDRSIRGDIPMLLLGTSPGKRGAEAVVQHALTTMPYRGARIIAHMCLPSFYENFQEGKGITNQEYANTHATYIKNLVQAAEQNT